MPKHRLEPHSDPVRCLLRMASWWTVVLILQIGALWEYTHATTCTASTKNTCAPTLQVTGTCTSSVCDCISGYVPTRTGCRGTITPTLDIIAIIGLAIEYEGNGEVLEGGPITLRCNPDYGDGQYIWKQGTKLLTNKNNREYSVAAAAASDAGTYSCKIKFTTDDFETAESKSVTITFISNAVGQSFTKVPEVVGMPAKAFAGASIKLACGNLPSGQTLTFEWYKGTVIQATETKQTLTIAAGSDQYSCKIVKDPATLAAFTTAESAKTNVPAVATTISGVFVSSVDPSSAAFSSGPKPDVPPVVYVESGDTVTFYCAINDTDVAVSTPTYEWKKDGTTPVGSTVSFSKTVTSAESGSYTCIATVGGTPYTSRPVQLNVETTVIDSVDLVATPATAIVGGYVYLDCQVKTADLRRVTYSWEKNGVALPKVTDRALQINNLANSDATSYKCTATVGLDSGDDTASFTTTAITSITPVVTCPDSTFGVGNKYTLTCGDAYTTPGLTYTWKEGTTVTGPTSQKYEITVKDTATSYTCAMSLGSDNSQTSAAFAVDPKKLLSADINLGSLPPPATYKPLTGSTVTLTCIATLAAGASGTPTYVWTKATTTPTSLGTAATFTFTAGTATDDTYTCTVSLGGETKTDTLQVLSSGTIQTPTINTNADKYGTAKTESFSEGGNYELSCDTDSYNTDLTYEWKKDGNIVGYSRVYQITNANKVSSAGSYICIAKTDSKTSLDSAKKTITIGEKGKPCQYSDECGGDQYDDACVSNRCVCATGYTLQGNTCSGQGIVTISMLLLVLCGLIKLIL